MVALLAGLKDIVFNNLTCLLFSFLLVTELGSHSTPGVLEETGRLSLFPVSLVTSLSTNHQFPFE